MFDCPACGASYDTKRGRFTHTTVHCDDATEDDVETVSQWTQGENNPFHGKTHSEDTREKMRKAREKMDLCGEGNPNYRHGMFTGKECEQCGEEYTPSERTQKYCSEECFGKSHRVDKQQQFCPNCGDIFTPQKEGRKYCSRECADEQSATYRSVNFYAAIRNQLSDHTWAKERYDNVSEQCSVCGSVENLHLHHIVPVMAGGLNESWNYLTLCASCHMKTEHYTKGIFTHFTEF